MTFFFEAANITNQILNFGLPAPIDAQIMGRNIAANYQIAQDLEARFARIPGAADVHIHQVVDYPVIDINVDRNKAGQVGLTQKDVSNSLLISLSSSSQVTPTQWLDWRSGVTYSVAIQTPQSKLNSMAALMSTPITPLIGGIDFTTAGSPAGVAGAGTASVGAGPSQTSAAYGNPGTAGGGVQLLSNLASVGRSVAPEIVNHYNVQPVYDVYANVDRRDLGAVGSAVEKILANVSKKLPRGTTIELRGQVATMESSFYRLGVGLVFAVALVYLLMVVNFQSWLDPFIILMALPGALAGIVWILFLTQTTFSVPSLMGSIMCIGVATSNSILMVVFANDQREEGMDSRRAAEAAGHTRIRPVLMTASAMIIGMFPMALGLGEGGEQNAPLGRAVIGGLVLATITTLFIVPMVYSMLRTKPPVDHERRIVEEQREYMESRSMAAEDL
jgi:multidrug efflux pump subunit AcrB